MADDSAWLGVRVVQGPNWSPSNGEYGGEGFVGTVVGMVGAQPGSIDQASSSAASGISIFSGVTVRWDTGATQRYEYGPNSTPDLRILDTAPAGESAWYCLRVLQIKFLKFFFRYTNNR